MGQSRPRPPDVRRPLTESPTRRSHDLTIFFPRSLDYRLFPNLAYSPVSSTADGEHEDATGTQGEMQMNAHYFDFDPD